MRSSLKQSIADSPVSGFERYAKGSIVLCNACSLPIFKLDYGIALGDKAGQMASAFKPVSLGDLETLAERTDIDAGIRALVNGWSRERRRSHIHGLTEMKTGDPMLCPSCGDCFVQVISVDKSEALDRAFTIELLTIPPQGKPPSVRGKRLGYNKEWVH